MKIEMRIALLTIVMPAITQKHVLIRLLNTEHKLD